MTDSSESRLDRIERLLESSQQRLDSTQQIVDSNARAIAANSAGMAELRTGIAKQQQQQQFQQSLNDQIADVVGLIGTYAEQTEQNRIALRAAIRLLVEALRDRFSGNVQAD